MVSDATRPAAAQELESSGRIVTQIFDELPPSGAHGQLVSVRSGNRLRQVQWDREAEEWKDLALMALSVTRMRSLSVAAGVDTVAWQELDAALASDIYLTAVSLRTDSPTQVNAAAALHLEVAIGADGAEDALVDELPVLTASLTGLSTASEAAYFPLAPPIKVVSGTRLSARALAEDDGGVAWQDNDEPQITVHYYTDDDIA